MTEVKKTTKAAKTEETKSEEVSKFKGKYIEAVGRRKTSIARVRVFKKGTGNIVVNNKKIGQYFNADKAVVAKQPLKLTGLNKDIDISVVVKGGGSEGQAEAIRHGISLALIKIEEELRPAIKAKGWVTRDARKKERKKPGLRRARRAPQWSKR